MLTSQVFEHLNICTGGFVIWPWYWCWPDIVDVTKAVAGLLRYAGRAAINGLLNTLGMDKRNQDKKPVAVDVSEAEKASLVSASRSGWLHYSMP